ncbi:MAG: hypothetical protein ACE5KH_05815 [Candidatus Geothermarchaeales archaeon]
MPQVPLGEGDAAVLNLIREEELAGFSFDGLKRRLGLHSETLSRTLGRLEERDIVERAERGYKVTSKAKNLLALRPLSAGGASVPLLRTLLPHDIPIQQVISDLMGRWFGMLRWLGYSEEDGGVTLKWITDNGRVQVDANFSDAGLTVEAKLREGDDLSAAVRASYQLMRYMSTLYSRLGTTRPGVHLLAFSPHLMAN